MYGSFKNEVAQYGKGNGMKGLLVALNASYTHTNLAVRLLQATATRPVSILEMTINEDDVRCLAKIAAEKPDFIMYSTYIWNWSKVKKLGSYIKKANPSIRHYLGGPEVSYDGEKRLAENPWIDAILCGEGESSFNHFLKYVSGEIEPSEVAGLCYRKGEKIVSNPADPPKSDLDDLPTVVYPDSMEHKIIYYESMRGCPYACSYCLSSTDDVVRYRSVSAIQKDMGIIFRSGTKLIKFVDRSFHIRPERTKKIIEFFIEKAPPELCVHFEMNLEHMTPEIIALMNRAPAGRFQIEAGIQSTNRDVNARIHRSTNLEKMAEVMTEIDREKIHVHVDLIAGLPGEDLESFLKGFDEVVPLGAKKIQIGFLKLLPGTELKARAEEFEIVYDGDPPYEVIKTRDLSAREILILKYFSKIVELYYDEDVFRETLDEIRRRNEKLSTLFYGMAITLIDRIREDPLRSAGGKHLFFYEILKNKTWFDEDIYEAFKKDFYRNENRYIGTVLRIDDPEINRQDVVAFLKKHPDFIHEGDPLKASKRVRGITFRKFTRYIYYRHGRMIDYYDERSRDG